MYIMGINCGLNPKIFHDSSACLIKDGSIVAFAEQERFDRIKHSYRFPMDAIRYCLDEARIGIEDVDEVAIDVVPGQFIKTSFSEIGPGMFNKDNLYGRALNYRISLQNFRVSQMLRKLFPGKKIWEIPHHLTHAASAFYVSGFKESNIMTIDGRGESDSTVLFKGSDNKIERIKSRSFFDNHSFGVCYTLATQVLNMGGFGEGKTMGLAPYGQPSLDFSDIISYNGSLKKSVADFSKIRSRFFKYKRGKNDEIKKIHKDLAASLQSSLEKTLVKIAEELANETGSRNMCLAGGVALNCVTNGMIISQDFIDDIFIQPAAGDSGGALGAAMHVYTTLGNKPKFKMDHAYWGPEFSNEEIERELKKSGLSYEYHSDITGVVAEMLGKNEIVGWFQGRMEVGPRALGNRSILASPTTEKMKDKVNDVKNREKWRPLCPSLLEEAMDEYFENSYPSPFMILSFNVKREKWKEVPSIVHVDGTARPQSVSKKTNPKYHELIRKFEKVSSVPVVLNTSFNDKTEPIVCTPADALRTLDKTLLKNIAIGNYLVKKK